MDQRGARFTLRPRGADDLPACVVALAAVHAADQYPILWPADPAGWLTPARLLAAWVAVNGEHAPGHIALCAVQDDVKACWALPEGLALQPLAEVCRLYVAPEGRGHGVGARLLAVATDEAWARGFHPALRVTDHNRAAIALYERAGWRRVASETKSWDVPDPAIALLHTYLAPE